MDVGEKSEEFPLGIVLVGLLVWSLRYHNSNANLSHFNKLTLHV